MERCCTSKTDSRECPAGSRSLCRMPRCGFELRAGNCEPASQGSRLSDFFSLEGRWTMAGCQAGRTFERRSAIYADDLGDLERMERRFRWLRSSATDTGHGRSALLRTPAQAGVRRQGCTYQQPESRALRSPTDAFVTTATTRCVLSFELSCRSRQLSGPMSFDRGEFWYRHRTWAIHALEERAGNRERLPAGDCLSEEPKQNGPERGRLCVGGGGGNRTRVRKHYTTRSTCLAHSLYLAARYPKGREDA